MQIMRYNENSDAPSENSQPIENNTYNNNNNNNVPTNNDNQFSKYIGWFSNVLQHVYSSIFYGTDTDYDNGQYSSTQSYSSNNDGYTQNYNGNNNGFTQSYNSNDNGYTQNYSTNDDGNQQEFYVDDVKDLHFSHQHGSHSTEFTATSSHGQGQSGTGGDDSSKGQSR